MDEDAEGGTIASSTAEPDMWPWGPRHPGKSGGRRRGPKASAEPRGGGGGERARARGDVRGEADGGGGVPELGGEIAQPSGGSLEGRERDDVEGRDEESSAEDASGSADERGETKSERACGSRPPGGPESEDEAGHDGTVGPGAREP